MACDFVPPVNYDIGELIKMKRYLEGSGLYKIIELPSYGYMDLLDKPNNSKLRNWHDELQGWTFSNTKPMNLVRPPKKYIVCSLKSFGAFDSYTEIAAISWVCLNQDLNEVSPIKNEILKTSRDFKNYPPQDIKREIDIIKFNKGILEAFKRDFNPGDVLICYNLARVLHILKINFERLNINTDFLDFGICIMNKARIMLNKTGSPTLYTSHKEIIKTGVKQYPSYSACRIDLASLIDLVQALGVVATT